MPKHNGPIGSPATEEALVDRMPSHTGSLFFVTPKRLHLLTQIPQIEQNNIKTNKAMPQDYDSKVSLHLDINHGLDRIGANPADREWMEGSSEIGLPEGNTRKTATNIFQLLTN
ncbi:hypothetical protein NQ318_017072 [Aromia moschata]|uniref:Uncharacterized protein n=1 Tax=Aromia moschata TaxID=1265417 RepID=A0AAV8XK63_9CUCU|nr:hypothetical protein NQ318_017072 [Aromia moschata]